MSVTRRAIAALALSLLVGSACGARSNNGNQAAPPSAAAQSAPGEPADASTAAPGVESTIPAPAEASSSDAGGTAPAAAGRGSAKAAPAVGVSTAAPAASPVPGGPAGRNAASPTPGGDKVPSSTGGGAGTVPNPAPGGGPTPAPGAAPPPGKASPVIIGTVGTQSGIVGNTIGPVAKGVQGWVADVNRRGGVNGHPVRHIIADDGGDPSRHQALVKQLVEEKGVIAFVGQNAALTGGASVSYLNQKGVPVIGSDGGDSWMYGNPMFFPQMTTTPALVTSTIGAGAQVYEGKKKIGTVSCVEVQGCRDYYELTPERAKQFGLEVVYRGQVTLGQPDFTAECLAARNAGAEWMILASDANTMSRVARSCANAGYHPGFAAPHAITDDVRSDPGLNGLVVESPVRPWFVSDTPALAEFHKAMASNLPGEPITAMTGAGWVAAKLFETAARNLPEPPTSNGVLSGLWSIQNDDLGGLTYPLTFAKDTPVPQKACWWPVQTSNGKWADRSGGKVTCRG